MTSRLLEGKVCMVTGCSRGIGREIARSFAECGGVVYACARTPESIDEYCKELTLKYETEVTPLYFDVTDSSGCKSAILRIQKEKKKLDVLVNNAGIMEDALVGMITREFMMRIFEINVFSVAELSQLAARLMRREKSGSIINMASIVAVEGSNIGQSVYAASKGAVISLTKSFAKELAADNIRVNAIAPGMIDTDLFHSIGEENVKKRQEMIYMKRLGLAEDVAGAAVFFASDLSSYVTGQVLGVDGGALV